MIEARNVSRTFGAVRALTGVSLDFRAGEVHGLVGANGAGKSTLLNVVGGSIQPTSGTVVVDGRETTIDNPRRADELGFAFIHQEMALVPDLSALDNMTLGLRGVTRRGLTDRRKLQRLGSAVAGRLGLEFDLKAAVRTLSPAERGMVEIARALVRDARFIAMDEPTAALSDVECQRLFQVIRDLAGEGVAVAYVSHRLNEIEDLSDRVTVFKDGTITARLTRGGYDRADLIAGITGGQRELGLASVAAEAPSGTEQVFVAEGLSDGRRVHDVSLSCRRGEIVGLAGVVGSGRSETFDLIFGNARPVAGRMALRGKPYEAHSVRAAIAQGVALVPEERRAQALITTESLQRNMTLGNWGAMRAKSLPVVVSDRRAAATTRTMMDRLRIKAKDPTVAVGTLSGGNQQKVVFGRWLARNSTLLLLDEPTRGVDVGARQQIWETVRDFAAQGNAVVVASSELDELRICHRVVVLVEGRRIGELTGPGVTEEEMLSMIYRHNVKETLG